MAKIREYERGRLAGLDMALRIVKKYGVDNLEQGVKKLEQECKARGAYNIHSPYTYNELVKISKEITEGLKARTLDTVLAMTLHTLQDEFGFGKVRLERFIARYKEKTECMMNGLLFWADIEEILEGEVKIKFTIRDLVGGVSKEKSKDTYKKAKAKKRRKIQHIAKNLPEYIKTS